jgi:hypothetical protein
MRVKEIAIERVKNLGNYESERIYVQVVVDPGESPAKAVLEARKFIHEQQKLLPVRPK